MNTVIKVENLSKLYDLGQVGTGTISKDLNRCARNGFKIPDWYSYQSKTRSVLTEASGSEIK